MDPLLAVITIPKFVNSEDLVAHLTAKGWDPTLYTIRGVTLLCFHWEVATDAIGYWY